MLNIRLLLPLLLLLHSPAFTQTFSGSGGAIPDNGPAVDFPLVVSGLPNSIDTLVFGLEKICLDITHTYDADLTLWLIAPDGTQITLASGVGGGGDNFTGTCFNGNASQSINQGNAPFSGSYKSTDQLGLVNNGQDPNGTWILRIQDTYAADVGTLDTFSITFSSSPSTYFSFSSTDLPLVLINTLGQTITAGPKITAWMGIVDNGTVVRNHLSDPPNGYSGLVGIEFRGNSSLGFAQKQFNLETRDASGNNLDAPLLGMPAENDWVLYGPYNDKTLLRNSLTFELSRQMGRYAPQGRYCEVIIDNKYMGVYTLFEKIKKDSSRVNIATLGPLDTSGTELTGGYICSIDWGGNSGWTSNFPPDPTNPSSNTVFYQYIYPRDINILPQQRNYIQQFVDSFETALSGPNFMDPQNGWRQFAGEGSFIDYFLMNEISKNVDGYRLSTFFYKEKITDGNKIHMGPLWDFNLAWHNADYCGNNLSGGWAYELTNYCQWDMPFWWRRLQQDTNFVNNVRCRWDLLRQSVLDTANIFSYIDSIAALVNEGQSRHYIIYPILGGYVWPNPYPYAQTYAQEIAGLKSWILQRINFMDNNLPGICLSSGLSTADASLTVSIFPNPASEYINVGFPSPHPIYLQITDALGKPVASKSSPNGFDCSIPVSHLPSGVYSLKVTDLKGFSVTKTFVKQ